MGQLAVMSEGRIDARVIEACQQGDREAFRLLFEAYKDRVYSIALHFFNGDETSAMDSTQQVFLKLIHGMQKFRREADFLTWLYRLVANVCLDEHRRRRRFVPFADANRLMERSDKKSQETDYVRLQVADSVRAVLAKLKPKLRITILLKYFDDLSYEEIAKMLRCSKGTVASRLNRGHKILARKLAHLRGALDWRE